MVPRVLVGCPTTDTKRYALARYLYALKHLTFKDHDVLLVDNSADPAYSDLLHKQGIPVIQSPHMENPYEQLAAARNLLREHALRHGYTHLLSLESDVIPPHDIIERLLQHGKGYVTVYMDNYLLLANKVKRMAMVRKEVAPGKFEDVTPEDLAQGPLIPIARGHLACTLISRDLLDKIVFRQDGWQWDDYLLCDDLRALGETLWCDTTLDVFHMCDGGSAQVRAKEWRRQNEQDANTNV